MPNTNFLQFDPQQTNMLSDANYSNDDERKAGFVTGISRSILFNKTLFQSSAMVTALANVIVNRGYDAIDNNLSSLEDSIDNAFPKAARGLPIGSIFPTTSPITVAPEGFLLPDGEPFDPNEYSELATAYRIGTDTYKYGQVYVDGTWRPRTPDLRGYFLRVHNPESSGIDANRTLGTSQVSQNLLHNHTGTTSEDGEHTHTMNCARDDDRQEYIDGRGHTYKHKLTTDPAGAHTHDLNILYEGGEESRPHNYALTYLIVAKNEVNLGSISGSITVDQVYDGTSPNAQSGIAIEGELANYQKSLTGTTVTLATANWSTNTQTVTVNGMTSTAFVWVSPTGSSMSDYASNGIYCSAQATDSLTFTCDTTPSSDLTVQIVYG